MPSSSLKQAIAMRLAAKGKSNTDIPQSVGREFADADKRAGKYQGNSGSRSHANKRS